MIKAILFDLDDTLLGNKLETFLPPYFHGLGKYASSWLPPKQFIAELHTSTQVAIENTDMSITNERVFWQAFTENTGLEEAEFGPFIAGYYETEFPKLQPLTQPRPAVPPLIQTCFGKGLKVVVATNPLMPRSAIEQRLGWAGVPVTENDYALVTTLENAHATKPNAAYYQEILSHIGCQPAEAIMVGDNWTNDIEPAAALGIYTYWVPPDDNPAPDPDLPTANGTMAELLNLVRNGWFESL